jgi:peptidoglycan/xylan/chitin deacetylase (PgdA/CDA1 family)
VRALSVAPEFFEEQLAAIREMDRTVVTFSALLNALGGKKPLPPRSVVLTFDDGYGDFWSDALPLLQLYNFAATVFVTTGWVRDAVDRATKPPPGRMLSWAEIQELAKSGIEIGSHSHSHSQLDQLTNEELRAELVGSKERLRERLGVEVLTTAYPYGYSSARVRRAVRQAGYYGAAAVRNRTLAGEVDPFAVPRLTIRRSIGTESFRRLLSGSNAMRLYWKDWALTAGWGSVRCARRPLRHLRHLRHRRRNLGVALQEREVASTWIVG